MIRIIGRNILFSSLANLNYSSIKILLFVLGLLLLRPTAFGQSLSTLGIIIILSTAGMSVLDGKIKKLRYNNITSVYIILCILFLCLYLMLNGMTSQSSNMDFVIKGVISVAIVSIVTFVHSVDKYFIKRIFDLLAYIFALTALSCSVTFLISRFIPLETMLLGKYSIEGYSGPESGNIYFPLSHLYSYFSFNGQLYPRFSGFFREAGIFQAVLLWTIAYVYIHRLPYWLIISCLLGVIVTFSTTGIIVGAALLILIFGLFSKIHLLYRIILLVITISFLPMVIYETPGIGLNDKPSVSISDRSQAVQMGVRDISSNLTGQGYYSQGVQISNQGINLISYIFFIGIMGFVLAVMPYFVAFALNRYHSQAIILLFPLFVTSILTQPLLDAPLWYVLMFSTLIQPSRPDYPSKRGVRSANARQDAVEG